MIKGHNVNTSSVRKDTIEATDLPSETTALLLKQILPSHSLPRAYYLGTSRPSATHRLPLPRREIGEPRAPRPSRLGRPSRLFGALSILCTIRHDYFPVPSLRLLALRATGRPRGASIQGARRAGGREGNPTRPGARVCPSMQPQSDLALIPLQTRIDWAG